MKPNTTTAMHNLLSQVREAMPFDNPEASICAGPCKGCPLKLLQFIETELDGWQYRLDQGETPNLGDINKLATSARKVHRVLSSNGLSKTN